MTACVLKVERLEKTFRVGFFRKRVDAVRGVSFRVEEGEVFGLLGPNGAGKTTTIKIAMGLCRASAGGIEILGHRAGTPASRAQIGYLPENPYFHEYLTARELLFLHGRLAGLSRGDISEKVDELLALMDLEEAAKRPLRRFSKGMLQRIGLAQAMLSEPRLLILDEPMSGLDPIGRRAVVDLIHKERKRGATIMFSSHILSDVERLCDRVVILNRGRKAAEGSIPDLVDERGGAETFEELFMRKAVEIEEPAPAAEEAKK